MGQKYTSDQFFLSLVLNLQTLHAVSTETAVTETRLYHKNF